MPQKDTSYAWKIIVALAILVAVIGALIVAMKYMDIQETPAPVENYDLIRKAHDVLD